jgi:hypothetical protein
MMMQGIDHLCGVPEDPAGRCGVFVRDPAHHERQEPEFAAEHAVDAHHERQEPEFAAEHAVDEHHVACVGDGHEGPLCVVIVAG